MERFGFKKVYYFFLIEVILYVCFLTLDVARQGNTLSGFFKFLSVFLCACYVWSEKDSINPWKHKLFKILYAFLLISDVFLLFTPYYLIGILTFTVVQMFYLYYLLQGRKDEFVKHGILRFLFFIVLLLFLSFVSIPIDWVLFTAVFYFVQFLCNVLLSLQKCKKDRICFLIGIILFFLCDINVGIYQAGGYLTNEWVQKMSMLAGVFMWLFYLPGQVLLAYSSITEK